jgi:hypothetical protein
MELDCLPCICRQTLESARMATEDENIQQDIMKKYAQILPRAVDEDISAPELSAEIQAYIKKISGVNDPYKKLKEKNLEAASKILDIAKKEIADAEDPFLAALLMAAMGNSIDAGVSLNVEIEENIERALKHSFKINDYKKFLIDINKARELLFIADNTGEALFDKLLLQKLKNYDLNITYVVREAPILNDLTKKEALEIGIDEYADIISGGSKAPGMLMQTATSEFLEAYNKADIVLSKGQGNLEGLYQEEENIYYLLKAKCELIAKILDVEIGDFIFIHK